MSCTLITGVFVMFDNWYWQERTYTSHEQCGLCPYVAYGISFDLYDSDELNSRVDEIRVRHGYKPCFDENVEYDEEGWYEFTVTINKWAGDTYRVTMFASPMYVDAEDRGDEYIITLTKEEQLAIVVSVDHQCREKLNMTLDELLNEAEKIEREVEKQRKAIEGWS